MESKNTLANALVALSALIWIAQAWLIAWCIDSLIHPNFEFHIAVKSAIGVMLLGVLKASLEAIGNRLIYRSARQKLSLLRQEVAASLCERSPLDKSRPASGMAASIIAEQAQTIIAWLTRYKPAQWRTMVVPLAILLAVAIHSWVAALILIGAAPMIPLFMAVVGWRAKAVSEAQMQEMSNINAFLLDRLRGLATLRALGALNATAEKLRSSGQSLKMRTMAVLRIAFLSSAVLELFSALGVALVAVYIGFHLLGEIPFGTYGNKLTLGQGFFILMLAPAFFDPLRDLSAAWHDRASGQAALESLKGLKQAQEKIISPQRGIKGETQTAQSHESVTELTTNSASENGNYPKPQHAVRVENLCFAHPNEAPIFTRFNLEIKTGDHVAITGPSGCGKSALLALLTGLIQAQSGRIEIAGQILNAATVDAIRSQIAWMGQAPHIFSGSVRLNTTLGRQHINQQKLQETLAQSGLRHAIDRLPRSLLGESGIGLSGGEIVRLALARLAANPQATIFMLDEPTSHLDTETAQQVIEIILTLAKDKTLIVATHDPLMIARLPKRIELLAPTQLRMAQNTQKAEAL